MLSQVTPSQSANQSSIVRVSATTAPAIDKSYALVDVDETLIRAYVNNTPLAIDYDRLNPDKGLPDEYLNLDLINALLSSGIKDVYLFSDMRHYDVRVKERLALITSLRAKKLIVHGVITPSDYVWDYLTDEIVMEYEAQSETLDKFVNDLHGKEHPPACEPGIAFKSHPALIKLDEKAGANSDKKLDPIKQHIKKCDSAKFITGELAHRRDKLHDGRDFHTKGLLYKQFLQHGPQDASRIIVCDDRDDVLESVNKIHKESRKRQVELTTVKITLHSKSEKGQAPSSKVDSFDTYMKALKPKNSRLAHKLVDSLRWSFIDNPTFSVPYIIFAGLVSILFPYAAIGFGIFVLMVMTIKPLRNIIHDYRHFVGFMLSAASSLILWPVLAGITMAKTLGEGLSWISFVFLEGIKNVSFPTVITAAYTTAISILTFAASAIVVALKELIYNPYIKPRLTDSKSCGSSAAVTSASAPTVPAASKTSVSVTPSSTPQFWDGRPLPSISGTGLSPDTVLRAGPATSSVSSHTNNTSSSAATLPTASV